VLDGLPRREVHQVHVLPGLGGEVDVARDHQALAERRPAAEPELGRDLPGVRMAATRQRRLLAVHGDRLAGDGVVLERAPHQPGRRDGSAVVGEAGGACIGERAQLAQHGAVLPLRDRGEEADGDARLGGGPGLQAPEELGVVDDRVGVRDREDRAVAAGRGGGRAGGQRLLVLAARRAEVDVRVDERRRKDPPRRFDHPVPVRVDAVPELGDHTGVEAHVEHAVDALDGIDDPRAADDEARGAHHATSTVVSTATGPVVSRS
jgi:hypothetical protein